MKIRARFLLLLQVHQNGQNLGADRGVEHRDRLVADQALGFEYERGGDRHPLALATGELVRVALAVGVGVEPDVKQCLLDALLVDRLVDPLDDERFGDDRAHFLARIERLVRILKDHLDPAAQVPGTGAAADRPAVEQHLAARGLLEAEHGPGQRRLAATRLAHDSEHLAPVPFE